jgi:hypothetical protein
MATVAPVLYTNINFPNLKEEFPGKLWSIIAVCLFYQHSLMCNVFFKSMEENPISSLIFICYDYLQCEGSLDI